MTGIGSRTIVEGAYGLGLLFFGKEVADPKTFYCPTVRGGTFAYDTYSEPGWPWPSIPPDYTGTGSNPYVRCSYNYYAQPRMTEDVATANYGTQTLPVLYTQSIILTSPDGYVQAPHPYPVPLRVTDVDPAKAASADLILNWASLTHKTSGQPAGVNVLFGDGHVKWVPVRGNNKLGSHQPFDPRLWDPYVYTGPGNDPDAFRIIMNGWMP